MVGYQRNKATVQCVKNGSTAQAFLAESSVVTRFGHRKQAQFLRGILEENGGHHIGTEHMAEGAWWIIGVADLSSGSLTRSLKGREIPGGQLLCALGPG